MNEPFCSIYSKSYRAFKKEPQIQAVKPCFFYEDSEENFVPVEDLKVSYNQEKNEAIIRKLYIKRLISTYQASYCVKGAKNSVAIDPNSLEADQFMVYFNKLYEAKKEPVPRPLDTSRTVYGYTRFHRYYTNLSVYQDEIGRQAYNYFKKDFDLGKSRLFSKKQLELLMRGKNELLQVKSKTEDFKANEKIEKDAKIDGEEKKAEDGEQGKEQKICSKKKICVLCLQKYDDCFC